MKTIQIGGGITLIVFSLFIGFGMVAYGLKESDDDLVMYLTIPLLMLLIGTYLIIKGKKNK